MQARWEGIRHLVLLVALMMLLVPSAPGQTANGTISGSVIDPSGQVIPGAKVSVTNEATGEARNAPTSSIGDFSFPSLLPATYTIQVEAPGFQTFRSTGNVLTPNARLAVGELRLNVGSIAETMEVAAQAAQTRALAGVFAFHRFDRFDASGLERGQQRGQERGESADGDRAQNRP